MSTAKYRSFINNEFEILILKTSLKMNCHEIELINDDSGRRRMDYMKSIREGGAIKACVATLDIGILLLIW
jgi:hypothetical protein